MTSRALCVSMNFSLVAKKGLLSTFLLIVCHLRRAGEAHA